MRYSIDPDRHAKLFGPKDPLDAGTGRSRRCKVCGDWHNLSKPWPHNCRSDGPRRNIQLSAPQIAPTFETFRTGVTDTAKVIGSRNEKREYMRENGLVEYDEGVTNAPTWAEEKRREAEIVDTIRRYADTDTDYWDRDVFAQGMADGAIDKSETPEIITDDIEVVK